MSNKETGGDGLPAGWTTGLALGFGFGGTVTLGVHYHDGGPWQDALLMGAGFFAFGFVLGYSRTVRSLLHLLQWF